MKFSVVVPVLNEAAVIRDTLQSLKRQAPDEIIVVDGNSLDNTRTIASQYADHVVSSAPGRARQMNVGAGYAEADVIVFLHADTQLPDGALNTLRDLFLSAPDLAGGRFRISFSNTSFKYKLISF
ncbi:MAG: glycosyltransferase, partial [Candidatus Omnitrophica bacterium]|nr:glycosyltransferase [Candidatus Omnitrophota bacterium]